MKKRSIRTVGSGLMCIGLAVGVMVLQSGNAEAQVARPLPGAGSTFLTNVSWQPVESTMMFGPQQDQSMPAYQAPKQAKPQAGTPNSSVPPAQSNHSNTSDEAFPPFTIVPASEIAGNLGSTYIPLDSWMYPALMRLYSLGYLSTSFVDMRPWTRLSVLRMLFAEQERIHSDTNNEQALEIYNAVLAELEGDIHTTGYWTTNATLESLYERAMPIAGTPLRDSYHLGQTIINDYGRPYEEGFNNYAGFSARSTSGPFALYVRGEYQHVPSADGYSADLAATLSEVDTIPPGPQDTIPAGPILARNYFRL
ncbi:MAG: capsule assembly Wzi family protein, partial [Acidobacteriaceae bacterium]